MPALWLVLVLLQSDVVGVGPHPARTPITTTLARCCGSPLPMTMEPSVRVLGPADVGTLRSLLTVFADAFEDPERYLERQPSDPYLHELLSRGMFLAVVAEAGTRVVGGLTGYVLPKFEQACREFYLYDLAVAHDHRRQGVATALIERLKTLAAERGLDGIFVQAHRDDGPAIALYSRLGVGEDVLHFDIAPEGTGPCN
nr:GNAT family N-acetyltransferase [Cyanobium sp. N.Huapi 1H5]